MSADANASPVGRLNGVGPGIAVFEQRANKLVDQVRMAAAVAAALNEAQVNILTHVIDALRREWTNGLRQQVGIIGNLHLFHRLTAEVQQLLGDHRVRAVAMSTTDGLVRGMEALDTGAPISVPVGEATLGPIHLPLPDPASADRLAILLAVLASYLLLLRHWGLGKVLALSAALGLVLGGWGGLA